MSVELQNYITQDFDIGYTSGLDDFACEIAEIATQRKQVLNKVFGVDNFPQVRCEMVEGQENYLNFVKEKYGETLPTRSGGAFAGGNVQISIIREHLEWARFTLAHELTHLYINKFIYEKYNLPRLKWWDETFAYWFERPLDEARVEQAKRLANDNAYRKNADMNIVAKDSKREDENEVFGLYKLIGFYLFTTHQEQKLLDIMSKDYSKTQEIGKTILAESIDYVQNNDFEHIVEEMRDYESGLLKQTLAEQEKSC